MATLKQIAWRKFEKGVSVGEVAKELGVSAQTARKWFDSRALSCSQCDEAADMYHSRYGVICGECDRELGREAKSLTHA